MVCVAVAVTLLVVGCSGGGRDMRAQVAPAGTFLSDQATVLALNMAWLPVLFPTSFNPGAGTVDPVVNDPTENGDGTWTWLFVNSDGSSQTWTLSEDWMIADGRIVYVDGKVATVHMATTDNGDGTSTIDQTVDLPDGSHLVTRIKIEGPSSDPGRLLNSQAGTVTTASGATITFTAERYFTHYVLTAADAHAGWVYTLTAPTNQALEKPDTSKAATGSLTRGTQVTSFALPANPGGQRWTAMTLSAPGGISGLYDLALALTGTGTVKQSGQILMTVQWGGDCLVTATLADGKSEVGEPSGAARDFLVDRWLWALGDFGPNPR